MQFLFYISLERSPYNTTTTSSRNSNKFIIVGFVCYGIGSNSAWKKELNFHLHLHIVANRKSQAQSGKSTSGNLYYKNFFIFFVFTFALVKLLYFFLFSSIKSTAIQSFAKCRFMSNELITWASDLIAIIFLFAWMIHVSFTMLTMMSLFGCRWDIFFYFSSFSFTKCD